MARRWSSPTTFAGWQRANSWLRCLTSVPVLLRPLAKQSLPRAQLGHVEFKQSELLEALRCADAPLPSLPLPPVPLAQGQPDDKQPRVYDDEVEDEGDEFDSDDDGDGEGDGDGDGDGKRNEGEDGEDGDDFHEVAVDVDMEAEADDEDAEADEDEDAEAKAAADDEEARTADADNNAPMHAPGLGLTPLLPIKIRVPSSSSDVLRDYTVFYSAKRGWCCNCKGFRHGLGGKACRHIRLVRDGEDVRPGAAAAASSSSTPPSVRLVLSICNSLRWWIRPSLTL